MFFHEDEIPLDIRINTLEQFSRTSLIAEMTLAGLFIKMGDNERARETINEIIIKAKKIEISGKEFHTITAYVVQPYCEKEKWQECLEITSKFSRKMKTIY
jgi:FimV-like protein